MARQPVKKGAKTALKGKLAGKTVAFAGKFGYGDHYRNIYEACAVAEGGAIVEIESAIPDYLIAGDGRGGNPPAIVAKVQKQHPSVQVLDVADLCRMLLPSAKELLAVIRRGPGEKFWDQLEELRRVAQVSFDLAGADLSSANLYGVNLESVNLDGADLRKISAHYAHFPILRNVKLDGADLANAYLVGAEDCSFRGAQMESVWFHVGRSNSTPFHFPRCDFSKVRLTKSSAGSSNAPDCVFRDANLSRTDFSESNFERGDFTGADLSESTLHKCNLASAKFVRANLRRADLREVSLVNADLRRADLREAVLIGADLSGAKVDGVDFAGANLTRAKIVGLDSSKAKNFQMQAPRLPGPKMRELAEAAADPVELSTEIDLDLSDGKRVVLFGGRGINFRGQLAPRAGCRFPDTDNRHQNYETYDAPTLEQGLINAAERWSIGRPRPDTVTATEKRCPIRGEALLELARAAWCEAFGVNLPTPEALQQMKAEAGAELEELRNAMLAEIRGGAPGIKKWNARERAERQKVGRLRRVDFSKAKLPGVNLESLDLRGSRFDKAVLRKANFSISDLEGTDFGRADLSGANLYFAKCRGASFEGADLSKSSFRAAKLRNANFRDATLTGADLECTDLRGADFSTAGLDGVNLGLAEFDESTKFPADFVPPESMVWKGIGSRPGSAPPPPPLPVGSIDFDTFFQHLASKVEAARLDKATAMLKAERFQLFADVKPDSLAGVVKSQSSAGLVYSCRLSSDGHFGCCTQNLNACGGLRGALCKHLLVLVIGLTKSGALDPATANAWVDASRSQKPAIDDDAMSETFLRYKGAEAGEIDWRPTETVPEDYYAL